MICRKVIFGIQLYMYLNQIWCKRLCPCNIICYLWWYKVVVAPVIILSVLPLVVQGGVDSGFESHSRGTTATEPPV